jgi:hypothetical protein
VSPPVEQLPAAGYETRDAWPGAIALTGAALAFAVATVLACSAWIYHSRYADKPTATVNSAEASFRDGPLERSGISRDWKKEDQSVDEHLASYGWIDRPNGVVRIPIDRAIDLVASESIEHATTEGTQP